MHFVNSNSWNIDEQGEYNRHFLPSLSALVVCLITAKNGIDGKVLNLKKIELKIRQKRQKEASVKR